MDKLDPTQRTAVSKMSTERLRIKLSKADIDEQLVSEMTREQLLEPWANCVLYGEDKLQRQKLYQSSDTTWSWKGSALHLRLRSSKQN